MTVVYNFWTGPNRPDRTNDIKFGLDWTRLISAHVLSPMKYFIQRLSLT